MQLSKISSEGNEDLYYTCGRVRRQWLSTPYKISAGSAAALGQFPWAVALTLADRDQYNYCGGSIISKRHILSAAHCIMNYNSDKLPCTGARPLDDVKEIVVRYGGICLRTTSPPCNGKLCRKAKIRKVAIHKRFMDGNCILGYDFAIIELETDLVFDSTTLPICLPGSSFDYTSVGNLFDYGFGENEKGEKMSRLNYGSAKIISVAKYHDFIQAGPVHMTRNRSNSLHGICTGDSGAGLQGSVRNRVYLLGVHSFGPVACNKGSPFTVTDTRPYAEIICQLTGICYQL
ncbi:unnamed protein product [Thelazia callipaeda]|uniref:Peptidase S1 domain-containing protein n=1 Tax=Thelazia callipaeda TaxID=103827 RepID=A0A0N5CY43_THECL|nr:unnamed protein product [Thelazia callipaeda]